MSSTSAPLSPTDSPVPIKIAFDEPFNATTCGSLSIAWTYTGNPSVVNLAAAEDDFFALNPTFQLLALNYPVSAQVFVWDPVNVPAGEYNIQGFYIQGAADDTFMSTSFFVQNGTDTSCLTAAPSAPSSFTPAPTSAPTSGVLSGISVTHRLSGGAIAGIVIGVLALAGGLLAALAVLCARRRSRGRPRRPSRSSYLEKNWAVLGSGDGRDGARALRALSDPFASKAYPHSVAAPPYAPPSPAASEDDVAKLAHEKPVAAAVALPAVPYSGAQRLSAGSAASNANRRAPTRKSAPAYDAAGAEGVELDRRAGDGSAPGSEPQSVRSSLDGPPVQPHVHYSPFADVPVLDHKASFGDRPMHLLMPDMPPPMKQ